MMCARVVRVVDRMAIDGTQSLVVLHDLRAATISKNEIVLGYGGPKGILKIAFHAGQSRRGINIPECDPGSRRAQVEYFRFQPFVIRLDANVLVAQFEIRHLRVRKTGAEFFGLFVHVHDQLRAVDPVRKSWVIFD